MFESVPAPHNPESGTLGGAFIICWVDRPTLAQAEAVARKCIEEVGWEIKSVTESNIVERADYADNPTGLEYFEQALVDKEVFVFHEYPLDE
jgi:hypothetical protein